MLLQLAGHPFPSKPFGIFFSQHSQMDQSRYRTTSKRTRFICLHLNETYLATAFALSIFTQVTQMRPFLLNKRKPLKVMADDDNTLAALHQFLSSLSRRVLLRILALTPKTNHSEIGIPQFCFPTGLSCSFLKFDARTICGVSWQSQMSNNGVIPSMGCTVCQYHMAAVCQNSISFSFTFSPSTASCFANCHEKCNAVQHTKTMHSPRRSEQIAFFWVPSSH